MRSEKLLCGTGRWYIKEKFPRASNCYKNNGLPACDSRQNYTYQRFAGTWRLHLQSFTVRMGRERFFRNAVCKLHGFTSRTLKSHLLSREPQITSTVTRTSNHIYCHENLKSHLLSREPQITSTVTRTSNHIYCNENLKSHLLSREPHITFTVTRTSYHIYCNENL